MLAALPVRLTAGPVAASAVRGLSPVRLTLWIAWGAVFLAALAVALLLGGVVQLSQRRAAFVSAVTHELRTPLTTFHMYTEMLSEGMVSDARQRQRVSRHLADRGLAADAPRGERPGLRPAGAWAAGGAAGRVDVVAVAAADRRPAGRPRPAGRHGVDCGRRRRGRSDRAGEPFGGGADPFQSRRQRLQVCGDCRRPADPLVGREGRRLRAGWQFATMVRASPRRPPGGCSALSASRPTKRPPRPPASAWAWP